MFGHRGNYLPQANFAVTDGTIYIILLMEYEHQCERLNRSIGTDSVHAIFISAEDDIST